MSWLVDRPSVAAAAAAYLTVVLGIGLWAALRTRTARDFFIAGQRLGLFVTALATISAAFSGFVFLGGPGLTFRLGMASLWIVLPVGITPALLCWGLARRLRTLAEVREVFTIPDAIACRFPGPWPRGLAAVAVAAGSVAYLAAQLLALGILIQSVFGAGALGPAIAAGLAVLLAYCVFGGMLAGVYTDVVQGLLMLVAAVAVFVQALRVTGGWRAMTDGIASSEAFGPAFLEPLGTVPVWTAFGFFFVFGVGVLGQPQMLHKFYMLEDPARLRWMPLVLGGGQSICLLVWIGIGLAVPALVAAGRMVAPDPADAAAPAFLMQHTPDLLAGVVLSAVLAAIMSTADSFVNIGSAALVRDLPRALGRPLVRELVWGRVAVVAVGGVAALLAWGYRDLIALLGTFAFGTFAAALAPTLAVGLNSRHVTSAGATASIATGLGANLLLEAWKRHPDATWFLAPGVPPAAVALAASFAALFIVSALTASSRDEQIDPDVVAALDV